MNVNHSNALHAPSLLSPWLEGQLSSCLGRYLCWVQLQEGIQENSVICNSSVVRV